VKDIRLPYSMAADVYKYEWVIADCSFISYELCIMYTTRTNFSS